MKILVTGGSGMVGKALQKILPDAIYASREYDLTDQGDVEVMMARYEPDAVIHLAARVSGIQENIRRPASHFDDNVLMNTMVLSAARRRGVKRFIGVLSTCVYPDVATKYPMEENQLHESVPAPTNFSYGYAKRMMAVQIEAYNKQYDTNYQYVIPCNIYGLNENLNENTSHFLGALIKKIYDAKKSGGSKIQLMGSGVALRQFMFADDFARVLKLTLENNITESFNVCPDGNISIKDITDIALSACDATYLQVEWDTTKPDGQLNKQASNKKLNYLFKNFNFTPLFLGIKTTYQHLNNETK